MIYDTSFIDERYNNYVFLNILDLFFFLIFFFILSVLSLTKKTQISANDYFSSFLRPHQSNIFSFLEGLSNLMPVCKGFFDREIVESIKFDPEIGIVLLKKILRSRKNVSCLVFDNNELLTNGMLHDFLKIAKKVNTVSVNHCYKISKLPQLKNRTFKVSFRHCWRIFSQHSSRILNFEQKMDFVLYGLYHCEDNRVITDIAQAIDQYNFWHHFDRLHAIKEVIQRMSQLLFTVIMNKNDPPNTHRAVIHFPLPANITLELLQANGHFSLNVI